MASDQAVIFVALLNRAPTAAEPEQIAAKAVHFTKVLHAAMKKSREEPEVPAKK